MPLSPITFLTTNLPGSQHDECGLNAPRDKSPFRKVDIPSAWQGAEMKVNPDRWLVLLSAGEIANSRTRLNHISLASRRLPRLRRKAFLFPASVRISTISRRSCSMALVSRSSAAFRWQITARNSPPRSFAASAPISDRRDRKTQPATFLVTSATSAPTRTTRTHAFTRRRNDRLSTRIRPTSSGCCAFARRWRAANPCLSARRRFTTRCCDTRPDLAALMFDPIATDRRGEVPEGEKPYLEIPVLNWHAGFLTGFLSAPVYRQCAALSRCAEIDAGSCRGARSVRYARQ